MDTKEYIEIEDKYYSTKDNKDSKLLKKIKAYNKALIDEYPLS